MSNRKYFWGTFLILIGITYLLKRFGIVFFHIDWLIITQWWPVILILIGLRILLPSSSRLAGRILIVLLVIFFAYALYDGYKIQNFGFHHFDSKTSPDQEGRDSSKSNEPSRVNQQFNVPLQDKIQRASLFFSGGACNIMADVTRSKLFEVSIQSDNDGYRMDRTSKNNEEVIHLTTDSIRTRYTSPSNEDIDLKLNPGLQWDLNMNIGAGKMDVDFSGYKIRSVVLKAGAASADIRFGTYLPETDVNIESAVSKITLYVPRSSGCEWVGTGALNSKQLEDFEAAGAGVYRTHNFASASKKVLVKCEGALSNIEIKRY